MEDLLDDESIRKKIEVLEQQETEKEKSTLGDTVTPAPERSPSKGSDHMMDTGMSGHKKQQLALPEIGSFSLIKDLVKDYTGLSKQQRVERRKLDNDSKRAFAGSLRATKSGKSAFVVDRRSPWRDETDEIGRRKEKYRASSFKGEEELVGRFTTSTKPWLEGYDTVRNQFKERKKEDEGRINTSVGRALFNLKRTLPPVGKDEANRFIK